MTAAAQFPKRLKFWNHEDWLVRYKTSSIRAAPSSILTLVECFSRDHTNRDNKNPLSPLFKP